MGVSVLASRRHPDVVVMAPALTEAGQSQNFKTLTAQNLKNHPKGSESTPAVLSESRHNRIHKFVVSEIKGNSKLFDEPNSVKGFDDADNKSIRDSNGALKKSPDSLSGSLTSSNVDAGELGARSEAYGYGITGENSSMNDRAPAGDRSDNMGLSKSSTRDSSRSDDRQTDGEETEGADSPKSDGRNRSAEAKERSDMDQLLKNFSAAISGGELSSGDFPAPNVEELLQVIKSMENTCETSDPALDAPADSIAEPEAIFPLSGTDLATFERELLDDMMTNFDDHLPDSGLDVKESLTKEKLDEAQKRQFEIERKCERLQRRLKKLQARCLGKHAGEEMTGLFEHAHRLVRQGFSSTGASASTPGVDEGDKKKRGGVSETALSSLADRLAASSSDQGVGSAKYRPPVKYFGSGSVEVAQQDGTLPGSILPKLPSEEKEELKAVAQQLHAQVHFLQNQLDSDVTASSSGGESCDEMQTYNNPHQTRQSIGNRALWRWSQDRAGVACRWTWLQAQISDLEYKIRQYNKNHRQNWMARGQALQAEEEGRSQPRNPPLSVNGYHGALPGALKPLKPNEESLNGTIPFQSTNCDPSMTACRTRPFVKSAYRKRKLLQMAGLHLMSKKAARPVTVRCGCHPPTSCALCTGRSDPSKVERLGPSTLSEKIALLDYSFHPVLSFPSDASLSLHLDAVMRLHEWQTKANRCNVKYNRRSPEKEKEDFRHERRQKLKRKLNFSERKNLRKIRKHTARALSAKLKKKLSARERKRRDLTKSEHLPLPLLKIKKTRKQSLKFDLDGESDDEGELYVETVSVDREDRSSRCDSPVSLPGPLISSKDKTEKRERDRSEDGRKRKEDDSYDIDNIVIPYSMAASTRVEKLQYKEILTPKWRIVDVFDLPASNFDEESKKGGQESETEDISDEAFLERHVRCEESEKKKFMSYIKLPLAVRSRANRRTDSRAESSGANTPDPMSPLNPDHAESGGTVSPLTTPPATPVGVTEESCQQAGIRRRTVSNSRWHAKEKQDKNIADKEKEDRCPSPDFEDEVQPYEPRIYPLSNEVYEEMLKDMPSDHAQYMSFQRLSKDFEQDHRMPESPSTSSTISAVEEDPNDPEWTVVNVRDVKEDIEYRNRNKR